MPTTDLDPAEQRLRRMFASVAAQVPDQPDDALIESTLAPVQQHGADGLTLPITRASRRRRLITSVGVSAALIAGAGIAAAAGVLPRPWSDAKGGAFLNSTDPAATSGAVVRLTVPGPESTRLQVVSDVTYHQPTVAESCVTLAITGPQGNSEKLQGDGQCDFVTAPPGSKPPELGTSGSSMTRNYWTGPSGTPYEIFIGQAFPGATAVALTNSQGATAGKGAVGDGYYVVYLPAAQLTSDHFLTFVNSFGKVLHTENLDG